MSSPGGRELGTRWLGVTSYMLGGGGSELLFVAEIWGSWSSELGGRGKYRLRKKPWRSVCIA